MKTHELAKALRALATLLEGGPNLPLEQARISSDGLNSGQMAVSLATLSELSRVDKSQWTSFISELGFPIEVKEKDGSRNILGKLLNYLEANPIAREQLKTRASARGSEASPELMKALSSLLRETP